MRETYEVIEQLHGKEIRRFEAINDGDAIDKLSDEEYSLAQSDHYKLVKVVRLWESQKQEILPIGWWPELASGLLKLGTDARF